MERMGIIVRENKEGHRGRNKIGESGYRGRPSDSLAYICQPSLSSISSCRFQDLNLASLACDRTGG